MSEDERDEETPEPPARSYEEQAIEACNRPGLEGGIDFWDLHKARLRDRDLIEP